MGSLQKGAALFQLPSGSPVPAESAFWQEIGSTVQSPLAQLPLATPGLGVSQAAAAGHGNARRRLRSKSLGLLTGIC
jgi:hypothetical protein